MAKKEFIPGNPLDSPPPPPSGEQAKSVPTAPVPAGQPREWQPDPPGTGVDLVNQIATPPTDEQPMGGAMIVVEVQDRLLMELKRRLFPNDTEGIIYSAITGDNYWTDQLFQLMFDTWYRLQTNLNKLQRLVIKMPYRVDAYREDDDVDPTSSASEKAALVRRAFYGMHSELEWERYDFKGTLANVIQAIPAGFWVGEIYWEVRNGEIVPANTRRIPARYYRYPYAINEPDRLMLNPSGTLGGTQLMDFPKYKFLIAIKQGYSAHAIFSPMMRCLSAWWIASRFGLEWFMNYAQIFGIPYRMAKYRRGDTQVYQQLVNMLRQAGSATWGIFPDETSVEILSAAGATGTMPQERLLEFADKVCDIMILGQTLTTEVGYSGSRALGGVHKEVLDEITEWTALWACDIINNQIVPGIIQYNYGEISEIPRLVPVLKQPIDLLQTAQAMQILFGQMKIPIDKKQLYDRIEFKQPDENADLFEPPMTPSPFSQGGQFGGGGSGEGTNPSERTQNENRLTSVNDQPGNDKNGNRVKPPDRGINQPHNQQRRVRASRYVPDYDGEPAPGEWLRFLENGNGDHD